MRNEEIMFINMASADFASEEALQSVCDQLNGALSVLTPGHAETAKFKIRFITNLVSEGVYDIRGVDENDANLIRMFSDTNGHNVQCLNLSGTAVMATSDHGTSLGFTVVIGKDAFAIYEGSQSLLTATTTLKRDVIFVANDANGNPITVWPYTTAASNNDYRYKVYTRFDSAFAEQTTDSLWLTGDTERTASNINPPTIVPVLIPTSDPSNILTGLFKIAGPNSVIPINYRNEVDTIRTVDGQTVTRRYYTHCGVLYMRLAD